jgi:hypothetical protein
MRQVEDVAEDERFFRRPDCGRQDKLGHAGSVGVQQIEISVEAPVKLAEPSIYASFFFSDMSKLQAPSVNDDNGLTGAASR